MKTIQRQKVKNFINNQTNKLEEVKVKAIKRFMKGMYMFTKFVMVTAVLVGTFYAGMYVVSSQKNPDDASAVMVASIEGALQDTSNQPVIMIIPEYSMIEKVKLDLGMKLPEREVVTITTSNAQKLLGIVPPSEPGLVATSLVFWKNQASKAGDGIKSGWNWFSEKVTF